MNKVANMFLKIKGKYVSSINHCAIMMAMLIREIRAKTVKNTIVKSLYDSKPN